VVEVVVRVPPAQDGEVVGRLEDARDDDAGSVASCIVVVAARPVKPWVWKFLRGSKM